MHFTSISNSPERLRLQPRFDLPKEVVAAFSSATTSNDIRCVDCLSKLQLPNAALPELRVLRLSFTGYGHQTKLNGTTKVGGSELEIADLDRNLIRLYPIEVDVIAGCRIDEQDSKDTFTDFNGSLTVKSVLGFGSYAAITSNYIKAALDETQYDLIHLHQPFGTSADAVYQEARKRGIPLVLSNLNSAEDVSPASYYKIPSFSKLAEHWNRIRSAKNRLETFKILGFEYLQRWVGRLRISNQHKELAAEASTIFEGSPLVAVSEHSTRAFRGLPTTVIGSPIDTEFFERALVSEEDQQALRTTLSIPTGVQIISYHARIVPDKGQDKLIQVARELQQEFGNSFHFVLAGTSQNQAYLDGIIQDIKKNNLENHFTIIPTLSTKDIRTLLSISSAFVFPTQHEGLGRSAIEAMLMQVPVIANNVGGIPSYITNNSTGLLVDKSDTAAMADGLARLLRDSDFREQIILKAEAHAREHFSAELIAKHYMQLAYGPLIHEKMR